MNQIFSYLYSMVEDCSLWRYCQYELFYLLMIKFIKFYICNCKFTNSSNKIRKNYRIKFTYL